MPYGRTTSRHTRSCRFCVHGEQICRPHLIICAHFDPHLLLSCITYTHLLFHIFSRYSFLFFTPVLIHFLVWKFSSILDTPPMILLMPLFVFGRYLVILLRASWAGEAKFVVWYTSFIYRFYVRRNCDNRIFSDGCRYRFRTCVIVLLVFASSVGGTSRKRYSPGLNVGRYLRNTRILFVADLNSIN